MPLPHDPAKLALAAEDLGLLLVVAFGSRISGDPPPSDSSDLDVAVLDPRPFTWERFRDVHGALGDVFSLEEIDLAFLNHADPLFRSEIFRTAERLYGDPDLFAAQKAYAFKAYADAADLRELERLLYRKKLAMIDREIHAEG